MKNRTLALRRETVTELGTDDLGRVAGGSADTCYTCVLDCVTPALIDIGRVPTLENCFTHHSAADCITDELCRR